VLYEFILISFVRFLISFVSSKSRVGVYLFSLIFVYTS